MTSVLPETRTWADDVPALVDEPAVLAPAGEESRATAIACRTLDIVVAAVLLVLLSPVLALIAIGVRVDSRGRSLFLQKRLGRDQRPFVVKKYRTMRSDVGHDEHREFVEAFIAGDADQKGLGGKRPMYKLTEDDRVTSLGRFLRRTSLDELPQLLNVLMGEMSLVGPRPPIAYEVERYPAEAFGRFAVNPGITGLWQVGGRSETSFNEMIALDLEYVRRRSLLLNLQILWRTVFVVLNGRGAA
jgi:lipopolysaccharide/colanic/teichoic acid biosynthesis glycosyltransferase